MSRSSRSTRRFTLGAIALAMLAAPAAFVALDRAPVAGAAAGGGVARPGAGGSGNQGIAGKGKHVFPVRGRHQYWDGFGAGRNHEGVDVGARCRTKLVATETGRVQYKAYHELAGNYVVVDVKGQAIDYAYMHLAKPASVRVGQRLRAGQFVGVVGDTGDATGCHLHFELWTDDWYNGGAPFDPLPYLKRWDH